MAVYYKSVYCSRLTPELHYLDLLWICFTTCFYSWQHFYCQRVARSVCDSGVSLPEYTLITTRPIVTKCLCMLPFAVSDLVLRWWSCDTLCASGLWMTSCLHVMAGVCDAKKAYKLRKVTQQWTAWIWLSGVYPNWPTRGQYLTWAKSDIYDCLVLCVCDVRRVPVLLGPVLYHKHQQRNLHPLRPVRRQRHLPNRSDPFLAADLARLRQQFPQPRYLHHLQQRFQTRYLQDPALQMGP